jgi:hypothetical protein
MNPQQQAFARRCCSYSSDEERRKPYLSRNAHSVNRQIRTVPVQNNELVLNTPLQDTLLNSANRLYIISCIGA